MAVASASPTGYSVVKGSTPGERVKMTTTIDGLNPNSILEAIRQGNEDVLDIEKQKIEKISEKMAAVNEIKEKIGDWQTAVKNLRGASPIPGESGVFALTVPSSSGIGTQPGSDFVSASVDPGTPAKDFTFGITQLASKDSIVSAATVADQTAALNWSGTLVFPHQDGVSAPITVTVTTDMSLQSLRSSINAMSDATGVVAEIVPSGSAYKFAFSAENLAYPINFTNTIAAAGNQLPMQSYQAAAGSVPSKTVALAWAGTITFPNRDGVSADVPIAVGAGDTLENIRDNINLQTALTGITAAITDNGNGTFTLNYTHGDGKPVTVTNAVAGVVNQLPTNTVKSTSSLSAIVTYRGEQSTYKTNSPKINGVTFNLIAPTSQDLRFSLNYSPADVAEGIQKWVDAHNSLLEMVRSKVMPQVDPTDLESQSSTGVLFNSMFIRNLESNLSTMFAGVINPNAASGSPKYLADVGIGYTAGKLTLDMPTLLGAINKNFKDVRNLFTFNVSSSNANFDVTSHPIDIDDSIITGTTAVSIARDGAGVLSGTITSPGGTVYTLSATDFQSYDKISGVDSSFIIKGPAGSPYEDFEIYFGPTIPNGSTYTSNLTFNQGISDQYYQLSKNWLDPLKGDFKDLETSFTTETDTIKDKLSRIEETNRMRLASMERQLERVMSVLQKNKSQLDMAHAIDDAMSGRNN